MVVNVGLILAGSFAGYSMELLVFSVFAIVLFLTHRGSKSHSQRIISVFLGSILLTIVTYVAINGFCLILYFSGMIHD